jgi:HTH-type transcriptional regulator / antitoxin HigA
MSTATATRPDRDYLKLIRQFPLRPIRSKRELAAAMKIAGHLATFDEGTLAAGEQDYLDALAVLIEDYQRRQPASLPAVTPLAMLRHLVEEHGMNITDLGRVVGSQSNASLILSGKRPISRRVMKLLGEHFSVAASAFV